MANARALNVIIVDTSATFAINSQVEAIKYIGFTDGTAAIKEQNDSGTQLWEASGTTTFVDQVCIKSPKGLRVNVTNGAKVYLYLK